LLNNQPIYLKIKNEISCNFYNHEVHMWVPRNTEKIFIFIECYVQKNDRNLFAS